MIESPTEKRLTNFKLPYQNNREEIYSNYSNYSKIETFLLVKQSPVYRQNEVSTKSLLMLKLFSLY